MKYLESALKKWPRKCTSDLVNEKILFLFFVSFNTF